MSQVGRFISISAGMEEYTRWDDGRINNCTVSNKIYNIVPGQLR